MTFRFFIILIAIFFFSKFSYAVENEQTIDSLNRQLEYANDSLKIEIYIQLANEYNSIFPEKALEYASQAEKLAIEINNTWLIGKAKSRRGVAYYHLNQMELSNQYYFEALNIFDSIGSNYEKAKSLNNIAWNMRMNDQLDDAIIYFNRSLEIAKSINDLELIQAIYNNLGTAYRYKGEQDKALEIYLESLKINQQTGNKKWEGFNLNNIGLIYLDLKQYEKSEESFLLAIAINLELKNHVEYAKNLNNLGLVFINKKDMLSANKYMNLADSLLSQNDFKRERLTYYYYKTSLLKESGHFKEALETLDQFIMLDKELNTMDFNQKLAELRRKYELQQEERDLEVYKRKNRDQRFIIFGGIGLFLLLLGILLLVLRLYKSKNAWATNVEQLSFELSQKNEELGAMNEEIRGINDNLELIVEDRTKKIKAQNEKLVKYAFINSHEIRGPLARVLGLLHLLGLEKKELADDNSFRLLKEATKELDNEIKQASNILADEDFFMED